MINGVSNRIYTGYREIDSFTGGIRKNDLFVFGSGPLSRKEEALWNIIKNVADQGKRILYINLINSTGLSYIPPENHENVINETGLIPDVIDIGRSCRKYKGIDLIVINSLDLIWQRTSYYKRDNVCYQLKCLAKNIQTPVMASISSRPEDGLYRMVDIRKICGGILEEGRRFVDYLILFYPPSTRNHCNDEDRITELEGRIVDFHTGKEKIVYMIYSTATGEIREYTPKVYGLICKAKTLGLDTKDAITFAFYWENRELPEDDSRKPDIEMKEDEGWILT